MEAIVGVLLLLGIAFWVCARALRVPARPAATRPATSPWPGATSPPRGVASLPAARNAPVSSPDEGACFDGYIWGRLEERHDQQQHGAAGCHDYDVFDGDDGFDDDS